MSRSALCPGVRRLFSLYIDLKTEMSHATKAYPYLCVRTIITFLNRISLLWSRRGGIGGGGGGGSGGVTIYMMGAKRYVNN